MPDPLTPAHDLPIFDETHLDHQTMGDESLRVEILALFASEIERLLVQAEREEDSAKLAGRLHAIKGLARNVGARRLQQVVTGLEKDCQAGAADLAPLHEAVLEAIDYLKNAPS